MAAHAGPHLEAGGMQTGGDDAGRALLLSGNLRMTVDVPADIEEVRPQTLDALGERRVQIGFLPRQFRGGSRSSDQQETDEEDQRDG